MFEPVNPLEALMQAASADPAKTPEFYRALLQSELYILTPEAEIEPGRDCRVQGQAMASGVHRA
jgi:hypothetical protein